MRKKLNKKAVVIGIMLVLGMLVTPVATANKISSNDQGLGGFEQ